MKKFRMRWISFVLAIAIGTMWAIGARAWFYTGDRFVDNFDEGVFPGWRSSQITERLFFPGDYFLGPGTTEELFFMDFGDDLQEGTSSMDIAFDNIDPSTGMNQSTALTVDLNGKSYTSQLRSIFPPRLGITVPLNEINLDLYYDPDLGCCSDLMIGFSDAVGGLFGLNNVVVDWSAEPEPSADFDGDGDVDGADFLHWQIHDGSESALADWREQFGPSSSLVASSSIPEPSTLLLGLMAAVTILPRRFGIAMNRLA